MRVLTVAVLLIVLSLAPGLAFFLGVLLLGVHLGRRTTMPRATYTRTVDAGTLGDIAKQLEDHRHVLDRR